MHKHMNFSTIYNFHLKCVLISNDALTYIYTHGSHLLPWFLLYV